MKKVYQKPEFTVIKQNQANAKFFVASGGGGGDFNSPGAAPQNPTGQTPTGANSVTSYDRDENGLDM